MAHEVPHNQAGNAQQRPFSFQIPPDSSINQVQANQESVPSQPGHSAATQPAQENTQGWYGYPEQRFSYVDTPIDDNTQTFDDERQAALLQEARQRYGDNQPAGIPTQAGVHSQIEGLPTDHSQYPPEKHEVTRMPSAYQLPPPSEPHPAHFAPYAEDASRPTPVTAPLPPPLSPPPQPHSYQRYTPETPHSPGPIPMKSEEDFRQSARHSIPPPQLSPILTKPQFAPPPKSTSPAPFSSYANGGLDLDTQHRPGQIAHPNMRHTKTNDALHPQSNNISHFHHGLCACPGSDMSACMLGLVCPCILYSRLTYRLGQRSRKQDPTDVLGFHKCNGHCFGFAALCACGVSGLLAAVTRTRVRHAYDVDGSAGLDLIESCCCCCCAIVQSEREVRIREQEKNRWVGPSTNLDLDPYRRVDSMRYSSA